MKNNVVALRDNLFSRQLYTIKPIMRIFCWLENIKLILNQIGDKFFISKTTYILHIYRKSETLGKSQKAISWPIDTKLIYFQNGTWRCVRLLSIT
jgi:hypothetical protein